MKLKIGKFYRVEKETSLMPLFEPKDSKESLEAIGKMRYIFPGGVIKIISIKYKRDNPWYRVSIKDKGEDILGWINGIALIGQEIKELVTMNIDKNYFIGALTRHERFVCALRIKIAGMKPEDLVPEKFTQAERMLIYGVLNESCFTDDTNNLLDVEKISMIAEEADKWNIFKQ